MKCVKCRKTADIVFKGTSFCWKCGEEHLDFINKVKNMSSKEIGGERRKRGLK